jgi:tRNA threonylcarbamoyladenosine biosynthesis protein TsaB
MNYMIQAAAHKSRLEIRFPDPISMSADLRILALETTGLSGSVAALMGGNVIAQSDLAAGQRSAQSLAPGIADLFQQVGWKSTDVQLIAVTVGPGSFTGLRVGVTTAKTLAYATGAAVLGIDTLAVIAAQVPAGPNSVWSAFDAQRSELFVARYERSDAADPLAWKETSPAKIVDGATWIAKLATNKGDRETISGPGLRRWTEKIPAGVHVVAESLWQPQAAMVGQLAWQMHQADAQQELWGLSPVYLRASAAEEKLATNQSNHAAN